MTDSLFVRVKPLNVKKTHGATSYKNVIRTAARHLLRELQAEIGADVDGPIDAARIHMNYILRGPTTSAGVADLARALLANAKVEHKRADAIQALEVVFSLPPGSAIDHREYFAAVVAWADGYFNVPIISAVAHLDENQVHAHLLLLPLLDGRLQGGALIGGPTKIKAMMSDFHKQVGQRFGLVHQLRAKRPSKASRDAGGRMVLDEIKSRPDRLNNPAVRDALVAALGLHAESLLALLGLTMPVLTKTKTKSFVEIMCAPVAVERKPRKTKSIHVGGKGSDRLNEAGLHKPAQNPTNMFVTVHVAPTDPASPAHAQPLHPAAADIEQATTTGQAAPSSASTTPMDCVALVGLKDASTSARISKSNTGAPSDVLRTKAGTTVPALGADEMRTHKDQSKSGHIPTAAGGDLLKTQQVDRQAGQADAHRCSPAGGGHPGPQRGMEKEAREYQRYRNDEQPVETWCADLGEFVQATGPPRGDCHLYP